jgi:hypothetical protein
MHHRNGPFGYEKTRYGGTPVLHFSHNSASDEERYQAERPSTQEVSTPL